MHTPNIQKCIACTTAEKLGTKSQDCHILGVGRCFRLNGIRTFSG